MKSEIRHDMFYDTPGISSECRSQKGKKYSAIFSDKLSDIYIYIYIYIYCIYYIIYILYIYICVCMYTIYKYIS